MQEHDSRPDWLVKAPDWLLMHYAHALLKEGSKSDKVDARKLADLLRTGMPRPVYHGEHGLRTLRELGRSYQTLGQDLTE